MENNIYGMKLHDMIVMKGKEIEVLRVPGGWIYTLTDLATSVFVPFDDVPKPFEPAFKGKRGATQV